MVARIDTGGGGGGGGDDDDTNSTDDGGGSTSTRSDDPRTGPQIDSGGGAADSNDDDERRDAFPSRDSNSNDDDDDDDSGGSSGSSGSSDDSNSNDDSGGSGSTPTDEQIRETIRSGMGGHGAGGVGNPGGVGTGSAPSRAGSSRSDSGVPTWGGGSSTSTDSGDDLDLSDDQRDRLIDRYVDRNAGLVDTAPGNDVDGGPFTRADLSIRTGDDGGFIVGPTRDAVVRERSGDWIDDWIENNPGLVDTGPNDPDGGRFAPDDIVVRRTATGISVGPSETAIERERGEARAEAAARDDLLQSAIDAEVEQREREQQLAWMDARDEAEAASMLDQAVDAEVEQREREQQLAWMDEQDQEQYGDIDWSFGLGDSETDEVEAAVDDTTDRVATALEGFGDGFEADAVDRAERAERDYPTPVGATSPAGLDRVGGQFGSAAANIGADVARLPSLGLETVEGVAWYLEGARSPETARERATATREFTTGVATATADDARENPSDFAAEAIVGGAVGGAAARASRYLPDSGSARRRAGDVREFGREFLDDERGQGYLTADDVFGDADDAGDAVDDGFDVERDGDGYMKVRTQQREVETDLTAEERAGYGETSTDPAEWDLDAADDLTAEERAGYGETSLDASEWDLSEFEDSLDAETTTRTRADDVFGNAGSAEATVGTVFGAGTAAATGAVASPEQSDTADVTAGADTSSILGGLFGPERPTTGVETLGDLTATTSIADLGSSTTLDAPTLTRFDRPTPTTTVDATTGDVLEGLGLGGSSPTSRARSPDVDLGGRSRDAFDGFGAFESDGKTWETGVAQSLDDALGGKNRDPFGGF